MDEKFICTYCDKPVRWLLVKAESRDYWSPILIGKQMWIDMKRAPLPPEKPIAEVCGIHKPRAEKAFSD